MNPANKQRGPGPGSWGTWPEWEDQELLRLVQKMRGEKTTMKAKWTRIAEQMSSQRTGKQCRERYINHLDPDIKKGPFTQEERQTLASCIQKYGNSWARVSKELPGRTDNFVKNYVHSLMRRQQRGTLYPDEEEVVELVKRFSSSGPSAKRARSKTASGKGQDRQRRQPSPMKVSSPSLEEEEEEELEDEEHEEEEQERDEQQRKAEEDKDEQLLLSGDLFDDSELEDISSAHDSSSSSSLLEEDEEMMLSLPEEEEEDNSDEGGEAMEVDLGGHLLSGGSAEASGDDQGAREEKGNADEQDGAPEEEEGPRRRSRRLEVRQEREQNKKRGRRRGGGRNRKRSAQVEEGGEEEEEEGGKKKRRKKKQREDKEESQKGGSGEKEQKAVKKRHRTSTSGRGRRRDRSGGEDKSGTVPEGGKRVRSSRHGRRLDTRDLLLMDLDDEDDEEEDDDASWHDGDPLLGQSSSSDEDELAQEDALGSVPFWLKQRALATAEEPATQVQREAAAAAAEGSGEGAHKASWFPGETHLHMDSIKEEDPQNVVHWPLVLMRNELAVNSGPLEQALVEVPEVGSSQSSSLLQLNPRLGCTADFLGGRFSFALSLREVSTDLCWCDLVDPTSRVVLQEGILHTKGSSRSGLCALMTSSVSAPISYAPLHGVVSVRAPLLRLSGSSPDKTGSGTCTFSYKLSQEDIQEMRSGAPDSLLTVCSPELPGGRVVVLAFACLDKECAILLKVCVFRAGDQDHGKEAEQEGAVMMDEVSAE